VLVSSIWVAQDTGDLMFVGSCGLELDAAFDRDARRMQVFDQERLGFGLGDEQDEREARVRGAHITQFDFDNGPFAEMEDQARTRASAGHQGLGNAETLEDLQRSRLDSECPRFSAAIDEAVDNPKAEATLPELRRQGKAGRAGTHDQGVHVV
jgi:hypothetical protein